MLMPPLRIADRGMANRIRNHHPPFNPHSAFGYPLGVPHLVHSYRMATTGSTPAAWRDGMMVARKLITKAVIVMASTSGHRTRAGSLSRRYTSWGKALNPK